MEWLNWLNKEYDLMLVALYAGMPLISAFVGWSTNVVALKMTFYPLEFVGIPPFLGWQGIIPRRCVKMSNTAVDLITSKLISIDEIFSRLDPVQIAEELDPYLDDIVEGVISEVMMEQAPTFWEMLPRYLKEQLIRRVKADAPKTIRELMEDIRDNINPVFDLKGMMVAHLTKDKALLNEMFLRCGHKEFRFIEHSGFYFGFLFGLIQMTVWMFYKGPWVLPLAGFIVGYATNALALRMIFQPLEPKKIGPWRWQGLFLKRQFEVSDEYAHLIANRILTAEHILQAVLEGPASQRLLKLVQKHVNRMVDEQVGITKPVIQVTMGTREFLRFKALIVERTMHILPQTMELIHDYSREAMDIENTLRTKMRQLTVHEFEGLLHPIFEEDEMTLILIGAALGIGVGFFQLLVMFGGVVQF